MRKHLSVFILDIVRNFKTMMIFIGAITVIELVIFLAFGLKCETFGEAVSMGMRIGGSIPTLTLLIILLWIPIITNNVRNHKDEGVNNKTIVHTEHLTRRLLISERAAVFWSILASSLRFVFVICFQILLTKIMYLIYLKYGNGCEDQLMSFVTLHSSSLLSFLFPGNNINQWVFMGILTIFVGVIGTAVTYKNLRAKDPIYMIVFFLIVFIGGYDSKWGIDILGALILGAIALITFVAMMLRCHTGKRPAKEEIFGVINNEKY